jgi:hypothetical protein
MSSTAETIATPQSASDGVDDRMILASGETLSGPTGRARDCVETTSCIAASLPKAAFPSYGFIEATWRDQSLGKFFRDGY